MRKRKFDAGDHGGETKKKNIGATGDAAVHETGECRMDQKEKENGDACWLAGFQTPNFGQSTDGALRLRFHSADPLLRDFFSTSTFDPFSSAIFFFLENSLRIIHRTACEQ
jgi:hypothetical protein